MCVDMNFQVHHFGLRAGMAGSATLDGKGYPFIDRMFEGFDDSGNKFPIASTAARKFSGRALA